MFISQNNDKAPQIPNTRIFEFPDLQNVFVLESDLYGNPTPDGLCFLAFYGKRGLMGKFMRIENLKKSSAADIKLLVERHSQS